MRALILLLALVGGMARAETVKITSGEHDGFTRIVVELAEPTPWQVGRTADGYALRLGRDGIRFDLTQAFRNIPRDRLSAIWADPATGELRLGIGCACHALPFEFRPNVIVIDVRDGAPPGGSSFEQALDGSTLPGLAARVERRPKARPEALLPTGFDWTRLPLTPAPVPVHAPAADIESMRETLLRQLSRGASQGLVTMALPKPAPTGDDTEVSVPRFDGQLTAGLGPRLHARTSPDPEPDLTAAGAACIEDARLDMPGWGDVRPYAEQMAEARGALVGEFDRPDLAAVEKLVRLQLYFGFGLEARASLQALGVEPPDATILATLALILDGESVPADNPFAEQAGCATAAALWAVLARPELRRSDTLDRPSVLRSFSALPLSLRRHLGPGLAERFLAVGDSSSASAVRDAILRAPGDPGAAARLSDARLNLAAGRTEQAAAEIEKVAGEAGPLLPQAMIQLVEARLAQGAAVDLPTIEALGALAKEQADGPLGPGLRRAEGLARASAGDFAAAFALSATTEPPFDSDLWPLLASSGPDSALLAAAVLPDERIPASDDQTRHVIARRLVDLGFAEAGLAWLRQPVGNDDMLLAARAELLRQDARAALRRLAGLPGAEADRLRAAAQLQLGDAALAAATYTASGDSDAAGRALWRAQDWAAVADGGTVLAAAAALAEGVHPPIVAQPSGAADDPITVPARAAPLARGRALVAESGEARTTLVAMLAAVPDPAAGRP